MREFTEVESMLWIIATSLEQKLNPMTDVLAKREVEWVYQYFREQDMLTGEKYPYWHKPKSGE